jgi:hypothetical protein
MPVCESQIDKIRETYNNATDKHGVVATLAKKHRVSKTTIYQILSFQTKCWRPKPSV